MTTKKIISLISRIILFGIIIFPFFFLQEFYRHFYAYLTGNIIFNVITSQWKIVVISIIFFAAFLIPLSYRRQANWLEYGLVGGFFVSLFIEMYGIPLTILFASKYFYNSQANLPSNYLTFDLFGVGFGMDLPMTYGAIIITLGVILILIGWITLYLNSKNNHFVTQGIYQYSRHPQYFGFMLIILGWFLGWPTILTLAMSPILIYKYLTVCLTEEKELVTKFPQYLTYQKNTPFFL